MSSAKRKELVEWHHWSPRPGHPSSWQILFSQNYGTVVPMTWMANKKEVIFPSLGVVLRSTADLPCTMADQCSTWERGTCDQAEMITKKHQGLTFCHSLLGELTQCGFHRTLPPLLLAAARRKDTVQGEWCVAPWAPPLSPAPPLLLCPARLTTGTLPLESRSSCSPLTFQSYFHSLHSHHTQTACTVQSGCCRSTWSSWYCSHLLT